jgi:hypothetical protein
MSSEGQMHSEWTAAALRPVARWVRAVDERGRPRLVMHWAVPDVTVTAVQPAATADHGADPAAA